MKHQFKIPEEVSRVTETLEKAGFEAYLVGGCVRDILSDKEPKDWDVTTNATPEQIIGLFEKTYYENSFGTVGVVVSCETNIVSSSITYNLEPRTCIIEITPYRLEAKYSDNRHPDSVSFSNKLEDDLKRRDFTVNAIAYSVSKGQFIDLYNGQKDIKDKIIRTVGNPKDRFQEDALRLLRAVRFFAQLGFVIEKETGDAILENAHLLKNISKERIRDEFIKIIMSEDPMKGIIMAEKFGILKYIIPELEIMIGVKQNGDHIYDVWEHSLRALQHGADRNFSLEVRLAALLHDIGKPKTRFWSKEKNDYTFYGHDVVSERITKKILDDLKFPKKTIETVSKLVRNHMFFSDIEKITLSAVRRIVRNVGADNVWDLMKVRACDRIGMGKPKEAPYRLRKYESMIEEAMRSPVSVGMLKIDGLKIMKITNEKPGKKIGYLLHALLEEVFDHPELNTEEFLENRAVELIKLSEKELHDLGEKGKEKKDIEEEKELEIIRKRHGVR
ncbi:MAG: CCA tRNA nucleotidyltransferase [Candidatus Paceibacterota bacterium]|jgi:putative nucleotidyltransferase with HDIG domain